MTGIPPTGFLSGMEAALYQEESVFAKSSAGLDLMLQKALCI